MPALFYTTDMQTAAGLLAKMKTVDVYNVAGDIIEANRDKVADLNRKQLMKGLNSKGQPLSPKYSEDPWFKSAESAKRYADWKKRLFPETPYDTPNLIITGVYHSSIDVKRLGQVISFTASASFAASVKGKYADTALGLNPDSNTIMFRTIIRTPLVQIIADKTGIKKS